MAQIKVPCAVYRGGTSRGIYFCEKDLPADPERRKWIFLRGIDAFNLAQVDGLGGGSSHTSKIAVISPSDRKGIDVNYTFVQVGLGKPIADSAGTCGNLLSAVGPFAVDQGLVKVSPTADSCEVAIWDTNIQKKVVAHVPLKCGLARVTGDCMIPGLVLPGARNHVDILEPGGEKTGKSLPFGGTCPIRTAAKEYTASIIDAITTMVVVHAEDLGATGIESIQEISGNSSLMNDLLAIRAATAVKLGWAVTPEEAAQNCPTLPRVTMVAPPQDYTTTSGVKIAAADVDILGKVLSLGRVHRTYPVDGMCCIAVSCLLSGTIPNRITRKDSSSGEVLIRLGHPDGVVVIQVRLHEKSIASVGVDRTTRRIMQGELFIPEQ